VIEGNYIGTNASGSAVVGSASYGIEDRGPDNTIGGAVAGAGNVIAYNGAAGVFIGQPYGGHALSGLGNTVQGNSIFANAGLGIDLGG